MPDPQIAVVRDADGLIHHASRYSEFVTKGLADGSLTEVDENGEPIATEEATNAGTSDAEPDHDPNARKSVRGSRNRQQPTGTSDDGDNQGVPESTSGS